MALSNGNSFNFSEGNSYSDGQSMAVSGILEPWYIRVLLATVQDRGAA